MRSSSCLAAVALLLATAWTATASAQQQANGFAVERLYPSAPGGGWVVMDDLTMRGGLGGALSLSGGYAFKSLVIEDGSQHLGVVTHQAFADVGAAITFDRYRLYFNLSSPLATSGRSGVVGGYAYTAPSADAARPPDLITDARIGYDVRLAGDAKSPFRLGIGAQLWLPNGSREGYETDDTYRAMLRLLWAGDSGWLTYAGHVGVHIRSLDDTPIPGSPQGSEALFGIAAGAKLPVSRDGQTVAIVGPEIYGETAFRSFFGTHATGVEALLSGRIEGIRDDGTQGRIKLGIGAGLDPDFGAPRWRFVLSVEMFDHNTDRDHDGISDSKDACPDVAGIRSTDATTNGCPPASPASPSP
jgi:hypothetical protein